MKNKQCTSLKKHYGCFYYLRLSFLVLTIWPIALGFTMIKRCFIYLKNLCISRPIVREPIHFIRSESVEQIDEWNNYDDEKKTIEIARFLAERNFDIPNKQNNEQNDLTKFPEIPYDDPLR